MEPEDLVRDIVAALQEEVQAARERQRLQYSELLHGEYLGLARDRHAYRFQLDDDLIAADGAPARLRNAGNWHDCEVASIGSGTVVLNLRVRLDGDFSRAVLQVDATYLLDLQIAQWQSRLESDTRCNWDLVLECLRPCNGQAAPPTARIASGLAARELNAEQASALDVSLTHRRSYLWGPPGTGKTTTVAALVEQLVEVGLSVLLVSNTNAAVDTAVARVLPRLPEGARAVRVGAAASESLSGLRPPVLLHEIVAERGDELGRRRDEAAKALREGRRELRRLREDLARCTSEIAAFEQLKRQQAAAVAAVPASQKAVRQAEAFAERQQAQLAAQVARAEATGRRVSAALRRDVELSRDDVEKARQRHLAAEQEAAELTARYGALVATQHLTGLVTQARTLETKLAAQQLSVASLQRLTEELDADLAALAALIVHEADVVACTAYKACLDQAVRERDYDVVVVDEASMLPLALSLLAAGLAGRSVVFAGDFRQLPPIVQSETDRAARWLGRDAFEAASIPEAVQAGRPVFGLVVLREQHRMREEIADLVSAFAYPEMPLRTAPSVRLRRSAASEVLPPVTVIDTSGLRPHAAYKGGTSSKYNVLHAQVLAEVVRHEAREVAVIAPFRAQAELLRSVAPGRAAATVHRFQGGEADVVVLDTTLGQGAGSPGWFSAREVHEEGVRLLNVAISRAREQLFVLADVPRLGTAVAPTGAVRRLLDRLLRSEVVPAESVVPVLASGDGLEAFLRDVSHAADRVVLCSKRLGRGLVSALVEVDTSSLTVVTVPPGEVVAAERDRHRTRLAELEAADVRVETRQPCLEDWAVVDDVVWTRVGGLLAPPERGGDWVRTQSREAADRLIALNGRRRAPWEPAPVDGRWTSACPSCKLPQARVERWDGRAWDECWRGTCARPATVRERVPEQPAADPQRLRREELRKVAVHDFLVDDK